jgi:enterochelin esterase-like enzyme
MKRTVPALLVAALAAASAPADTPAPSAVRGSRYPLLHDDGRVTFRVRAPDAKRVQVVGRGGNNGLTMKPLDLTRGGDGFWTITTPVRPGFHYYTMIVDGFGGNDPASHTYFGWGQETSGLEVPDPKLDFYAVKDVPHGDVRVCTYHSKVAEGWRRVLVYTPPDYDRKPDARYPVLYLQHGAGESERAWTMQGRAAVILDNLIAAGKAPPMLVVMENGYATSPGQPHAVIQRPDQDRFPALVVNDLVPFIDGKFRTKPDRESRAVAGLSMGGGQAMRIGLGHLDRFARVGSFSGAMRDFDLDKAYGGALRDASAANGRIRLLWIGCGTEDNLHKSGREIHEKLTQHGIRHEWVDGPGAHEWQVWRHHLRDFASRLFR